MSELKEIREKAFINGYDVIGKIKKSKRPMTGL